MEVLLIGVFSLALLSVGFYFTTDQIFFDRTTGLANKYYIKTMDGFRFSSSEDYDPKFGVKYERITPAVAKEYYLWKSTGKINIPSVVSGQYFDMITGEAKCWYVERSDGKVYLFSLPGYDPMTGIALKPIAKEIISSKKVIVIGEGLFSKSTSKWKSDNILLQDGMSSPGKSEDFYSLASELKNKNSPLTISSSEEENLYNKLLDFYMQPQFVVNVGCSKTRYGVTGEVKIEKILFLKDLVIIGLIISSPGGGMFDFSCDFIDCNGVLLQPINCLPFAIRNERRGVYDSTPSSITVASGEQKRLFYVFKNIGFERIKKGKMVPAHGGDQDFTLIKTNELE